jgi:hypothetical protein
MHPSLKIKSEAQGPLAYIAYFLDVFFPILLQFLSLEAVQIPLDKVVLGRGIEVIGRQCEKEGRQEYF